ncbi:MAG TPA: type IV secretion system protein VirB10 [Steroidobacteraceae bacterium]|nr:type IV secretion system protein VirB10 [Steroidobacteraceae bacterium]
MSGPEGLDPPAEQPHSLQGGFRTVAGERSTAAVHRVRSLESRVSNLMAVGLICALGFGLLVWYYSAALRRPARAAESAKALATSRAQGEMPLPSLGVILGPPLAHEPDPKKSAPVQSNFTPPIEQASAAISSAASRRLAALPLLSESGAAAVPGGWNPSPQSPGAASPAQRAFERRLSGPVFARQSDPLGSSGAETATGPSAASVSSGEASVAAAPSAGPASPTPPVHQDELTELLMPAATPAVLARVLPTQRLLLPKGAFIDCTLETAIDSTLPGMTTCITATDTFSADGKVVLLERGSKLVGETRGEVQQGSARVFVLWTEARTPTGVVIPLASPGTDELGRSGLSGQVERHFWERFGAALLISIIDAASEAAVQSTSNAIIYNPTASQDVTAEVLKDTLRIPPTVVKNQGDRIQVLVARDLDFRSVYELRAETSQR